MMKTVTVLTCTPPVTWYLEHCIIKRLISCPCFYCNEIISSSNST